MEHRRYWFFPVRSNLGACWKDFYTFASGYNRLPAEFIDNLGHTPLE